jgi:hypothetical protein
MSANIYWRPTANRGKSLGVAAPSSFIGIMRRVTSMDPPWTLGVRDLDSLRGAAAASDKGIREGFEELIEAIERVGDVTVEVNW